MLCHVFSALTLLPGHHEEQQMPLHPQIPSTLASFKPSLVLPFWYAGCPGKEAVNSRNGTVWRERFGAAVLAQRQTDTVF